MSLENEEKTEVKVTGAFCVTQLFPETLKELLHRNLEELSLQIQSFLNNATFSSYIHPSIPPLLSLDLSLSFFPLTSCSPPPLPGPADRPRPPPFSPPLHGPAGKPEPPGAHPG
ncbi:unnamed protein product [Pleuronectes platessa]|uniref:Uncharacterized protein n=1 Tax=Pleuronectes platessa TaxID=8262 RepID=A0A9N7YDV2_PLEPL|nr:unnamed protein product [Pleuronectes platessa]